MWLNENAGVIAFVVGIVAIVLLGIALWILFALRSQFCVQMLKFTALYATDRVSRERYASLTIGNRSVREVAVKEIGIKNGGVAFDLTALYRSKKGLAEQAHIVIEQRASIDVSLSVDELMSLLPEDGKGGRLGTLRLYAIDLMGNVYQGRIGSVRKLLSDVLRARKAEAAAHADPGDASGKKSGS